MWFNQIAENWPDWHSVDKCTANYQLHNLLVLILWQHRRELYCICRRLKVLICEVAVDRIGARRSTGTGDWVKIQYNGGWLCVGTAWLPVCHLRSTAKSFARIRSWHSGSQTDLTSSYIPFHYIVLCVIGMHFTTLQSADHIYIISGDIIVGHCTWYGYMNLPQYILQIWLSNVVLHIICLYEPATTMPCGPASLPKSKHLLPVLELILKQLMLVCSILSLNNIHYST